MPELLVDFITSLDGFAAAEGWPGYWGLAGPEYLAWLDEAPERDYTVLMGATTYRLMSGFAAESDDDSLAQLTEMSKVVFSSTLDEPLTWANTRLVRRRSSRGRAIAEGGEQRRVAHARKSHVVPVLARGRAGRPIPGRRLPRHHRQHRAGADLRRVSGRRPRADRQSHVRRQAPTARLQANGSRRPTGSQASAPPDLVRHGCHTSGTTTSATANHHTMMGSPDIVDDQRDPVGRWQMAR